MDWRSEAARPRPALAGGARIPVIARQSYSFPRRVFARVMQARRPSLDERAQGKPGAECTRSLGGNKKSPPVSPPQVQPVTPAFPAQWFDGFLRALPGERRFLSPLSAGYLPQNRRHGRGARTTRLRRTQFCCRRAQEARRIAASIAFRPDVRDDRAIRPLWTDRNGSAYATDLGILERGIFFIPGLDTPYENRNW